jgi:hypothetical protein
LARGSGKHWAGPVRSGPRRDKAWEKVQSRPQDRLGQGECGEARSFVNLTLEIEATELSLNLDGGYSEQFKKVQPWLRRSEARRFLKEHPELVLVIFVRHATAGLGGRVMWKGAKWIEEERMILSQVSPIDISTRLTTIGARLDEKIEKLALHIRRAWTPADLRAMNDASEVAGEVEAWLEPIQQFRMTPSQS